MRAKVMSLFQQGRPVLRLQLTLLYSGLFLGLIAIALFAANVLRGSSSQAAPGGPVEPASSAHQFEIGAALIGLVAAAVALVGAWWLAGRILRPLRAIASTAQEISATNLHKRLNLHGPSDELTVLGKTLDDLFARLEASFDSQRHFVANASHELRTPLAGQRTLLQVALADPDADTQSLRATCEEALQLGTQQERLIEALLTLAGGEGGVERWEPLDLSEITENIVLSRRQEAAHQGIEIATSLAPAPVAGDPSLMESLISNLVENAIIHNHLGGQVQITTTTRSQWRSILVSNAGPVIAQEEVGRLFQPFQRLGQERVQTADGHGLGLAIVRAIADAHGATLAARALPAGGLEIEVSFPAPRNAQGDTQASGLVRQRGKGRCAR